MFKFQINETVKSATAGADVKIVFRKSNATSGQVTYFVANDDFYSEVPQKDLTAIIPAEEPVTEAV
nr:hypothetical protein 7 [bacterium]